MKVYKDIIQQSEEWFEIKKMKMSGSHAQAIATGGKGLESYVYEIISNVLASSSDNYTNPDMERGNELEQEARVLYTIETGNDVEQVGFVELNDRVGCSPDGLVGKNGGIEVKCPNNINYTKILLNGIDSVDTSYIWQIQMNLLITGRKWWDYVAYNPNFKNPIIIIRILPDEEKFERLRIGFEKGIEMINDLLNKVK